MLEQSCDVKYDQCKTEDEDWKRLNDKITFVCERNSALGREAKDFIKVPFKEASSLVMRRAVFLNKGIAYVPLKELYSIAAAHFRTKLTKELI